MTGKKYTVHPPLTDYIVTYDYDDPSPHFTQRQREFINSIQEFLPHEAVKDLRKYEFFKINLNVVRDLGQEGFYYSAVSGLRYVPNFKCLYLGRFSEHTHREMVPEFIKYATRNFSEMEKIMWSSNGFRVTLPNGGRFYPISLHGDLDLWHQALHEAADHYHTVLGHFDRGRFIVSDDQTFEFMQLKVERCLLPDYPAGW